MADAPVPIDAVAPRLAEPAALRGVRILVVEDDEDSRGVIALLLEGSGAVVTASASVADALDALHAHRFDIVVSDIEMPGEDGYALVGAIRRTPELSALPVIALTAHAGESERHRALDSGFAAHVAKPVGEGQLPAIVARVLRANRISAS